MAPDDIAAEARALAAPVPHLPAGVPDLPGRVIDVVIYGGSRPALLRDCIATFREHVTFDGRLRLFYQDCGFDADRAAECMEIVEAAGGFEAARIQAPVPELPGFMSYGYSITRALADWSRAPLLYHVEDDHVFLRPVDLDVAFDLFAQHGHINQIRYNRRKNPAEENHGAVRVIERQLLVNGTPVPVTSGKVWYFMPAVWRRSYFWPRWRARLKQVQHEAQRDLGLPAERLDAAHYIDDLGLATMGGIGEAPYLRHTGTPDQSVHVGMGRV